jgi:hypothetical protein
MFLRIVGLSPTQKTLFFRVSAVKRIQFTSFDPISVRDILIFPSHIRLVLPRIFFPLGIEPYLLIHLIPHACYMLRPSYLP